MNVGKYLAISDLSCISRLTLFAVLYLSIFSYMLSFKNVPFSLFLLLQSGTKYTAYTNSLLSLNMHLLYEACQKEETKMNFDNLEPMIHTYINVYMVTV